MELLCYKTRKRAVENLNTESAKVFAGPASSEVMPLAVAIVEKLSNPTTPRLFEPQDLTGWTIRAGVGKVFQLPVAGSFTLTYGANTTAAIAYDAVAATIEAALNALASVIAAGGLTVSGSGGYYFFTFDDAGARTQITADADNLAPLSVGETGTLIEGTVEDQEVQTLRLFQHPGAYGVMDTFSDAADIDVEVTQVGGGGFNHKVRLVFTPLPYDGRFSVVVGGLETELLEWNVTEEDFTAALEARASVDAGNVSVFNEREGVYLIGFKGDHANEDMGAITADASLLKVIPYKSGSLDFRTAAMQLLLSGSESVDCIMEVEGIPPGGTPEVLFRADVTVEASILDPANLSGPSVIGIVGTNYRVKDDGTLQFFNADQNKWHTLSVEGAAGEEFLSIAAGED